MDIASETEKLLRDLGVSDGGSGSTSSSVSVSVQSSAPPPPPPPPPPPATAKASWLPSKPKASGGPATKDIQDARKEIDDIFDSVISFAGKTSAKKKTPPPVAPKPKRKVHVSSYTMQIRSKGPGGLPPPKEPTLFPPPPPPPATTHVVPVSVEKEKEKRKPIEDISGGIVPTDQQPIALVAFGPGLESFEVNSIGNFQVSCPHDTEEDDLEIVITGPSGTKPPTIEPLGNGQFSCSYQPTVAGDHTVAIKVKGEHIPGSPFTSNVQLASYTEKCSASGPGLLSGSTESPCHFTIRCTDDAGYARLRIHILGPSKAEPIEMVENPEDRSVDVTYNPSAAGDYTIRILWGEAHVHGSPFSVPVSGPTKNDVTKVKVSGDGLKGGNVNEALKFFVEGEAGAGPGPLGIRMVGPSKPQIIADTEASEEGVEVTFTCRDPGEYQLILRWGEEMVPGCPLIINIGGEGRKIRPDLCTASGEGISKGEVGSKAKFTVKIPDEAGPGGLSVSVSGPYPPKPIEITNHEDGTMDVTYLPIAPGDYQVEVFWSNEHIAGSPFTATVTGKASRNPKLVEAEGDPITGNMKCNQLGTILVRPKEGAGPGPLRAKLEGPGKADLQLSNNQDGTMLVSFVPKGAGTYRLHLLWGEGDGEGDEISGSPFSIKVEKN